MRPIKTRPVPESHRHKPSQAVRSAAAHDSPRTRRVFTAEGLAELPWQTTASQLANRKLVEIAHDVTITSALEHRPARTLIPNSAARTTLRNFRGSHTLPTIELAGVGAHFLWRTMFSTLPPVVSGRRPRHRLKPLPARSAALTGDAGNRVPLLVDGGNRVTMVEC